MRQPWHERRPELLAQVRRDVARFAPTLHVFIENGVVFVRGTFPVMHNGDELDRYAIAIEFPQDYPESLPIVREVGGRIPWSADRHNFRTFSCLFLPEERWRIFPPGTRFIEFLRVPVHNYFLGQSIVARGGRWPFDEEPHGTPAVLRFYETLFGTRDPKLIDRLVLALANGFKGHWACPCGSGKILRRCHLDTLRAAAKKIPPRMAMASFVRLHPPNQAPENGKAPDTPSAPLDAIPSTLSDVHSR